MNKILLIIATLIISNNLFASQVQYGRVVDIKGSGFISYDGHTHEIKKGEIIYVNSELIIEHSGQVTFTDNADHQFHLTSASSVFLSIGQVELRNGNIWVQSINKMEKSSLVSANAKVDFEGGEAIFSYDSLKGKTQLMVINGLMKLENLRAPELNLTVAEGNFSFVDQGFEEGMPRDPTPVGEKSYGLLVKMFHGISPMDPHSESIFKEKGVRSIASISEVKQVKQVKQTKKNKKSDVTKLIVKIYGSAGANSSVSTEIYDGPLAELNSKKEVRKPASNSMPEEAPLENEINTSTPNKYKESEKLINQLKML